jgi:hypothetical protein
VGREVGTLGECTVGCTLGGGVCIGVGGTLGEVVGVCWGCIRTVSGVITWVAGLLLYRSAASEKSAERSVSPFMEESHRSTGIVVSRALSRLAAAAMTRSLGVANELERYLCLKNAEPKIRVARIVVDQNFQHR